MKRAKIVLNDLGKAFRNYGGEWRRFASWFGLPVKPREMVWVLRHVSFFLNEGDAVGIIGRNGAGKSTLLKIITGTLYPTEGTVTVNGWISAILELGLGFTLELTGRQNVYHSLGLMGFTLDEIEKTVPGILDFSELDEYFDQPLRVYSSGMQMRLAFSIVTAVRPDVLIVDEALSVGDTYFQHKSFDRIRQFQRQGTTLLIVSHDRNAIQSLCNRAILLDKGRLIRDGDPEEVFDYYNALIANSSGHRIQTVSHMSGKIQTISGNGEAQVKDIGLYDETGRLLETVAVGQPVELRIRVQINDYIPRLVLGYMLKDRLGSVVFGTNTHHTRQTLENLTAGQVLEFKIKFNANLGSGSYSVSTALVCSDTHLEKNYEWKDLALIFEVINLENEYFIGTAWLPPEIEIREA